MNGATVTCGACRQPLPAELWNSAVAVACPACQATLRALVFPALLRPAPRGEAGARVLTDGEASCFYHPQKKAALVCDRCGRFLCNLCDVDLAGEHVCPGCLQSGVGKGRLERLEARRVLYDDIALGLAVWPVVFCGYLWPVTAPLALYYAIRYWNAPGSLVPRSKARFIWAIVLAGLELVIVAALIVRIVSDSG
jgi:LSD1 subclass zinc finger protein